MTQLIDRLTIVRSQPRQHFLREPIIGRYQLPGARGHDFTAAGEARRKEIPLRRLLKVPEVAILLNVSVKTTWKIVYSGKVDVVRIGRAVRIPEDSVDKLIDDGTIPADDDDHDDDDDQ